MNFQPVPVAGEPLPNGGIFVVRGVVLDQNRSTPAIVPRQLLQEIEVGRGVEDDVLSVMKSGVPQFDGTQDLHTLALSGDRDFGRVADPAPGGMQGGVLPEAGFVGEDQRPAFGAGFFLRLG